MSKLEDRACIFGKEIKDVCPVLQALSRKKFSDYAKPAVKSPALAGMSELTEGLREIAEQMQNATSPIFHAAPFCNSCPYPKIYIQKMAKK